ncbi:hypothetical protein HK096_007787, partial [Nowakowskiella sp. JEL0078]
MAMYTRLAVSALARLALTTALPSQGKLLSTGEIMAVKVVFLKEDELRETLLEMDMLKACDHPNITKFMGSFLKGLDLWICMELCTGGALDSVYRAIKKPLNEDQIASIIYESVKGLDYIHTKVALIHRDIKAGNLLLTENGELKIADFGVSAKLNAPGGRARTFIGTPYWMAPEVIMTDPESSTHNSASYDHKADIWSIGITAIEIADKNPPLSDIHPMRALHLIPNSDLGLAKPKNWSKPFVDFVSVCLIKDPNQRPSAAQLLEHPFMQKAKTLPRQKIITELVVKAKIAKEKKKAGKEDSDEEEEVEKGADPPSKAIIDTLKQAKQVVAQQIQPQSQLSPISATPSSQLTVRDSSFQGFVDMTEPDKKVIDAVQIGQIVKAEVYTADLLDNQYLLIGLERGLYFFDLSIASERQEPIPLIRNTRFKQVQVIPEYGVIMALSGNHNHLRQYKLQSIRKLIKLFTGANSTQTNVQETSSVGSPTASSDIEDDPYDKLHERPEEDEQALVQRWTSDYIKIVGTRESKQFVIQQTESTVYAAVLFRSDVILFEWAKEPYLKFMKLKQFWLPPEVPKAMHLLHDGVAAREIYLCYNNEANLVSVDDSQVREIEVHRDFLKQTKSLGAKGTRWQTFEQIPFSESKRSELQASMRPSTVNRKLASVVGPTLSRGGGQPRPADRYFLATYHRHTRVVDVAAQPMIGAGVGGWKDGVNWAEPPQDLVLRPLDHVYAVGKNMVQVANWKTAQVLQTLQVDMTATIKILTQKPGAFFMLIDRKKKGSMIVLMKEKEKPKPSAEEQLKRSMSQMSIKDSAASDQRSPMNSVPPSPQSFGSQSPLTPQYTQFSSQQPVAYQYYDANTGNRVNAGVAGVAGVSQVFQPMTTYQIVQTGVPNTVPTRSPSLSSQNAGSGGGGSGGGVGVQPQQQTQYYAYHPQQIQYQYATTSPVQGPVAGQAVVQGGVGKQPYFYVPNGPQMVDPRFSYLPPQTGYVQQRSGPFQGQQPQYQVQQQPYQGQQQTYQGQQQGQQQPNQGQQGQQQSYQSQQSQPQPYQAQQGQQQQYQAQQ